MSIRQFRILDLGVLSVIAFILEAVNTYAFIAFGAAATFSLSVAAVVGMIAIFRWNVPGIVVGPIGGLGSLVVYQLNNQSPSLNMWLAFTVGYLGLAACLIFFRFLKKEMIKKKWYLLLAYAVGGYLAVDVVRTLCYIGSGYIGDAAASYFSWDLLNMLFAFIILVIANKQRNFLIDMKEYLMLAATAPASALEREEQARKDKLKEISDSNQDLNDIALLDGGTLSKDDLRELEKPFRRAQRGGEPSFYEKQNEALAAYQEGKDKKKQSSESTHTTEKKGRD